MEDVVVKRLVAVTSLALIFLLASCSESDDKDDNNNNKPTEGEGSLEIVINNLPSGNINQFLVSVRGPNGYTKLVDKNTTLNALKPGRYEVIGFDFDLNNKNYYVDPPQQAFDVVENQKSTATVAYTDTGSTSTRAQGFLSGFNDSDEVAIDARIFAPLASQQTGNFKPVDIAGDEYSNNRFMLELDKNLNPALLSEISVVADAFTFTDDKDAKANKCTRKVDISDEEAFANDVFFIVSRLTIDTSNGDEIKEEIAETILFEREDQLAIFWIYADRDVKLTGDETCNGLAGYNQTILKFDVNMKTGWNLIAAKVSEASNNLNIDLSRVDGPRDDRWGVLRDDPAPTYGDDADSTANNPKGKLGGWTEAKLGNGKATGTVFDTEGRPTKLIGLGSAPSVSAAGDFNITLPIPPENLLKRLQFGEEDGCTGDIKVADDAFYQNARLEIYVNNKRVGFAVAEDKDTDVDWWYLDKKTTLNGEVSCPSGNDAEVVKANNVQLSDGWNMVLNRVSVSVSDDGLKSTYTTEITAVNTLPDSIGWRFDEAKEEDSVPTEPLEDIGGPDFGSTSSNLVGDLGSWPDSEGKFKAILKAPESDPTDENALKDLIAGESAINTSGEFDISLTTSVSMGYLEELDIASNWIDISYAENTCSGDIAMSKSAKYAQALLDLYDANDARLGNASARVGGNVSTVELAWVYLDSDVKASGTRNCAGDIFVVDNLDFKAGWNILQTETATLESGNSRTIWKSLSDAPAETLWIARV